MEGAVVDLRYGEGEDGFFLLLSFLKTHGDFHVLTCFFFFLYIDIDKKEEL